MKQNKLSGILGIAKKAGKTVIGTDMVAEAIRGRKSKVVLALLSADASVNTVKRITNCTGYYHIPLRHLTMPFDSAELGRLLGRTSAISSVAITDAGLAGAVLKITDDVLPDHSEEIKREGKL